MDDTRDERRAQEVEREQELPEHETRPEGPIGAGLTTSGVTAEQYGEPGEEGERPSRDEGLVDEETGLAPD